jgi:endonuclease/exonuclease/phosphatase family metal-dependent hydrolase
MFINLTTWNLLSTELASPSYHVLCNPEHLKTENRWNGIKNHLLERIKNTDVICLQELSDEWLSYLIPFFQDQSYSFVYDSQWLGVGIGFPNKIYKLHDIKFVKIADELKKICKPLSKPEDTFISKTVKSLLSYVVSQPKIEDDTWVKSMKKHNRLLSVRLQHYTSGTFFNVFTYHMPCAFREPSIMHIHTAMLLKTVRKLTGKLPFILAGDFNMEPNSSTYKMITKGGDYKSQFETSLTHKTPDISVNDEPLQSAYGNGEPLFTCYSQPKGSDMFLGCIDYIFISKEFSVTTLTVMSDEKPKSTFPNKEVFSDHLPVSCGLSL